MTKEPINQHILASGGSIVELLSLKILPEPLRQPRSGKRPGDLISSHRQKIARKLEQGQAPHYQFDLCAAGAPTHASKAGAPRDPTGSHRASLLINPHKMAISSHPPAPVPQGQSEAGEDQLEHTISNEEDEDDTVDPDSDQDYESDDSSTSTTTTVDESVAGFFFENGRRYHRFREGLYPFPNDSIEQEREELLHVLIKSLGDGKLHQAPIGSHPQNILDVGTGTGTWAVDIADMYPSASVLGVDLSPIQPRWTPVNATFVIDDVESSWPYPHGHFDYIHCRQGALAIRDWSKLCKQSFTHIKPGGWIELQEFHYLPMSATKGTAVKPTHPMATYWNLINDALSTIGIRFEDGNGNRLADELRSAGFQGVTDKVIHVPIGAWPRDASQKALGKSFREAFVGGLQACALGPLSRCLQWDRNRVELLLMSVRRAYNDDSQMIYYPFHVVTGRKPL